MLEAFSSTMMHLSSEENVLEALTLTDFIKAQGEDGFCRQAAKQIHQSGTDFSLKKDGKIEEHTSIGTASRNIGSTFNATTHNVQLISSASSRPPRTVTYVRCKA